MKLTDTQLRLLAAASHRDDRALERPSNLTGSAAAREEAVIRMRSPQLGAKLVNLSPAMAEELELDYSAEGVAITAVENGSIAQRYGFQRGDILIDVNNTKILTMQDLLRVISQPARLWRITILRDGEQISAVFGG